MAAGRLHGAVAGGAGRENRPCLLRASKKGAPMSSTKRASPSPPAPRGRRRRCPPALWGPRGCSPLIWIRSSAWPSATASGRTQPPSTTAQSSSCRWGAELRSGGSMGGGVCWQRFEHRLRPVLAAAAAAAAPAACACRCPTLVAPCPLHPPPLLLALPRSRPMPPTLGVRFLGQVDTYMQRVLECVHNEPGISDVEVSAGAARCRRRCLWKTGR